MHEPEYPGRLHHRTPAWVEDGALFHLRVRAVSAQFPPLTDSNLSRELLAAARRYHALGHWWCKLFLIMPDHIHAIAAFPPQSRMSEIIRDWKRGATRFQRVQWQENYFDHRIRHREEANETWIYIRKNPVVKKLCSAEDDWPHWWSGCLSLATAKAR